MKKKGKIIAFILIIILVASAAIGYYVWDRTTTSTMEKAMEDPALDYFDKYMSANTGASAYKVSLEMLKEANEEEGEEYNLKALDKCEDKTTTATINIDFYNGKITDTIIKLDCEKF